MEEKTAVNNKVLCIDLSSGDITTPWGEDFPDPEVEPTSSKSGCSCRTDPEGGSFPIWPLLVLAMLFGQAVSRRRRPRRLPDHE